MSARERMPRLLTLILLSSSVAPLASAQSTSSPGLVELTHTAIERLDEAKSAAHRYTGFDLAHNQNRNEKGKLYADTVNLYEDTWIADLPFKRLVEVDGHPLTGKDLEKERQRYDQAVHARLALDDAARAKLVHERFLDAGLDVQAVTSSAYRLTRLGDDTLNGHVVTVLDAAPSSPSASAPLHYTLWITNLDPTILRLTFQSVADTPRMLRGSHGQKDFLVLEGTPLPAHTTIHALVPVGHETVTVDTEHTYSRYRRFTATTHMLPATETPSSPQM